MVTFKEKAAMSTWKEVRGGVGWAWPVLPWDTTKFCRQSTNSSCRRPT